LDYTKPIHVRLLLPMAHLGMDVKGSDLPLLLCHLFFGGGGIVERDRTVVHAVASHYTSLAG
jgi:hypothetical protein